MDRVILVLRILWACIAFGAVVVVSNTQVSTGGAILAVGFLASMHVTIFDIIYRPAPAYFGD